jgi:hypothetical protein
MYSSIRLSLFAEYIFLTNSTCVVEQLWERVRQLSHKSCVLTQSWYTKSGGAIFVSPSFRQAVQYYTVLLYLTRTAKAATTMSMLLAAIRHGPRHTRHEQEIKLPQELVERGLMCPFLFFSEPFKYTFYSSCHAIYIQVSYDGPLRDRMTELSTER